MFLLLLLPFLVLISHGRGFGSPEDADTRTSRVASSSISIGPIGSGDSTGAMVMGILAYAVIHSSLIQTSEQMVARQVATVVQ
ncbi:hypothetical protein U1Q18_013356 [Sarracenia purpurea var. burkii]